MTDQNNAEKTARLAEFMGWERCRCVNPYTTYEEDLAYEPAAHGNFWCTISDDSQYVVVVNSIIGFNPYEKRDHLAMVEDNLTDEQQSQLDEAIDIMWGVTDTDLGCMVFARNLPPALICDMIIKLIGEATDGR